jgi:hypothetical protein
MQKRLFQLLLLILWFSLLSISALADNEPADELSAHAETSSTSAQESWDKTKEMSSNALESSQEFGSTAVEKTKALYQSAKVKGAHAGQVIAETSRSAWQKTKAFGADVAEKASEFTESIKN